MNSITIPMTDDEIKHAQNLAKRWGMSSIEEAIRAGIRRLGTETEDEPVVLSKRAEKRLLKMQKDFETGKNIHVAHSVEELMRDIEA